MPKAGDNVTIVLRKLFGERSIGVFRKPIQVLLVSFLVLCQFRAAETPEVRSALVRRQAGLIAQLIDRVYQASLILSHPAGRWSSRRPRRMCAIGNCWSMGLRSRYGRPGPRRGCCLPGRQLLLAAG